MADHSGIARMMAVLTLLTGISLWQAGMLEGSASGTPSEAATQKSATLKGWSAPLQSADIGRPSSAGSSKNTSDGLEVVAGGKDIWGSDDEFHFTYQKQTGAFDVAVRVRSLTAPQLYARAGLMARADLSANSQHIFFLAFPDNRPRHNNTSAYELQYREMKGGESKGIYPPPQSPGAAPLFPVDFPNVWLRLKRSGNEFSSYASSDGKNWRKYASYSLDLPTEVYLGLAVTSHTSEATTTAVFSDFTVSADR
jgi:hypothetical protein